VTTYIDSSALVAVYVPERFSKTTRRALQSAPQIPFTQIHELELLSAFELMVGRGAISREESQAIGAQFHEDVDTERLLRVSLDLERVFVNACELSQDYAAKTLARSLDLLHVAAAHLTGCTTFVSGDDRQLTVARATGLAVVDIKRRAAR
jgi:predicted nucleic acid-binding protein